MRMALMYADAAGAEPDAVTRSELLDLCVTCWRQAQFLRRWPGVGSSGRSFFLGTYELSPSVSVDLCSGLPSRQRHTQLGPKSRPSLAAQHQAGARFFAASQKCWRPPEGGPQAINRLGYQYQPYGPYGYPHT